MAMMQKSDEELMLLYQQDDAQAFEMLYRRHKDPLYRYLLRQCQIPGVAEELFQDVWMKLIRARERYEVRAKFTTYLYHMAHNILIDYYRKQKHGIPISYNESDEQDDTPGLPGRDHDNPAVRASLQQQMEILQQQLEQLPDAQREAFLLHEEAGLNIEEIARATDVNPETAKSRLRYAIRKLRAALGPAS